MKTRRHASHAKSKEPPASGGLIILEAHLLCGQHRDRIEVFASALGLTNHHWQVMEAIAGDKDWSRLERVTPGRGVTIDQIFPRTSDLDRTLVRRIVNSLLRKKQAEWRHDAKRNVRALVLTRAGHATVKALGEKSGRLIETIDRRFATKYSPKERDALYRALCELSEMVRCKDS